MATEQLSHERWKPFFDRVSESLTGKQVHIEVASLAVGDQVSAEWMGLHGITYDDKDDIVEIALEGLDHIIRKPNELYAEYAGEGLVSMEIIDSEGTRRIIKFKSPMMLAGPV